MHRGWKTVHYRNGVMETWRTPNFVPQLIFSLTRDWHVSEINAPAELGRGVLPEKLDRCGQLASKNPYPIDRFMLKGALWVIRANLQRRKAVKQIFFYIFLFWFHIWWWNIYSRWRNLYSRFTSIFELIEWMLWVHKFILQLKPNDSLKS